MNVTVGGCLLYVTDIVDDGEIPVLQLLILVTDIQPYRLGQHTGAFIGCTDA